MTADLMDQMNHRYEERKVFTVTFDFTFSAVGNDGGLECASSKGISSNISEGGLGFFTSQDFKEGQPIIIYNKNISDSPISAEIRWCKKHSDSLYKIGVCFN
ncbi:MAG: PilZ domain-containing protein [Thermodesulfovibrionales bacterium]|nr:PilZ domain-containing protein [Thermodesulfovibrionales bacterium]